jgi:hypothetical protein
MALVIAGIKPWDFPKLRPDWVPPPPGTVETIEKYMERAELPKRA